jgi:sugar/nucleoside kinase (ribokinase family)
MQTEIHTGRMSLWLGDRPLWADSTRMDPAAIVSPVGAGDAFCAGCLYRVHEGRTVDRCLHLAHRAATAALRGATATDRIPPLGVLLG